jgi:cytochrome c biogenesis factor
MLLAELGSAFLLASLALVLFSAGKGVVAGRRDDAALAAVGRRAFYASTVGLVGASVTLITPLLGRDFTVA